MTLEDRVLRHVQAWLPRFTAGRLQDRGLLRPPYEPGERFGLKLPHAAFQRLPAHGPDAAAAADRRQRAGGLVYATDRRVLLADAGKVLRAWSLADLEGVEVLPGFVGVLLLGSRTEPEADGLVDVLRPGFDWDKAKYPARWLQVEACHAAATGTLDAWVDALPGRLGR